MEASNPKGIPFDHLAQPHHRRCRGQTAFGVFPDNPVRSPRSGPAGHFLAVQLANGVTLDFAEPPPHVDVSPQHYAFLVSEEDFDKIYGRILEQKLEHWPIPGSLRTGSTETTAGAEPTSSTRPVTTSKS